MELRPVKSVSMYNAGIKLTVDNEPVPLNLNIHQTVHCTNILVGGSADGSSILVAVEYIRNDEPSRVSFWYYGTYTVQFGELSDEENGMIDRAMNAAKKSKNQIL